MRSRLEGSSSGAYLSEASILNEFPDLLKIIQCYLGEAAAIELEAELGNNGTRSHLWSNPVEFRADTCTWHISSKTGLMSDILCPFAWTAVLSGGHLLHNPVMEELPTTAQGATFPQPPFGEFQSPTLALPNLQVPNHIKGVKEMIRRS
jgi:hypothetical protein